MEVKIISDIQIWCLTDAISSKQIRLLISCRWFHCANPFMIEFIKYKSNYREMIFKFMKIPHSLQLSAYNSTDNSSLFHNEHWITVPTSIRLICVGEHPSGLEKATNDSLSSFLNSAIKKEILFLLCIYYLLTHLLLWIKLVTLQHL